MLILTPYLILVLLINGNKMFTLVANNKWPCLCSFNKMLDMVCFDFEHLMFLLKFEQSDMLGEKFKSYPHCLLYSFSLMAF